VSNKLHKAQASFEDRTPKQQAAIQKKRATREKHEYKVSQMEMDLPDQYDEKFKILTKKIAKAEDSGVLNGPSVLKLKQDFQLWQDKKTMAIEKAKSKYVRSSFTQVTTEQWLAFYPTLVCQFFAPPTRLKKHWTGTITTDGISCSWHIQKDHVIPASKKDTIIRKIDICSLGPVSPQSRPSYYGTHAKDIFINPVGTLNVVAIDPGIVTLIDAVRSHAASPIKPLPPLPDDASKRARRQDKLTRVLANRNMTHFSLSNAHWHRECGHVQMRQKNLQLTKKLNLQPAIDDLANHTSRVHTSQAYLEHVAAKLRTLDTMKTRMVTTSPRRWAFDCYRREQLAVHKLSKDLLAGCVGPTVIVWGNGSFGSSYRGHASAPNKRLRNRLAKYAHVVLSSEYRSSQRSGCCHVGMTDRPSPRRVTVKQCTKCKTLVSRDVSAACVIHDIFYYQRKHQTDGLPPFITNENT
jgi:hypothetical protein